MPLYMDRHNVPGLTLSDAAEAHLKDLEFQTDYGCTCITYWADEDRGNVFCLINSPNKQNVSELHLRAHGLIPHDIIEVDSTVVKSFLGRINDPDPSQINGSSDRIIINDPAFRYLLVVDLKDRILFECLYGKEVATQLIKNFHSLVHDSLPLFAGRIVENREEFLISFVSVTHAIDCAILLRNSVIFQNTCYNLPKVELKAGLSSGFPVSGNTKLFGNAVATAKNYSFISDTNRIFMSSGIKEQYKGSASRVISGTKSIRIITSEEDTFLSKLLEAFQNALFEPEINLEKICTRLGVSTSRLYRNTIQITGLSPNDLLREMRLHKAVELMQKQNKNISETTYELGFTNPSYFAKCFKKRFNVLPAGFIRTLHSFKA